MECGSGPCVLLSCVLIPIAWACADIWCWRILLKGWMVERLFGRHLPCHMAHGGGLFVVAILD